MTPEEQAQTLELAPCPFCGKDAAIGTTRYSHPVRFASANGDGPYVYQHETYAVNCCWCMATARGLSGYRTRELAAEAWNKRAGATALRAQGARCAVCAVQDAGRV